MLLELHIKNFAIIDSVDINFSKGLNILTGETGAGKSILIDSINFILGEKQTREIIRTGQESAYVEAVFESSGDEIFNVLKDTGIEPEDLIIISREINQNGRSISRINGRTVTIGTLKQISRLLIDIHGQHEHQSLLDEEKHIDILDSFCGENFKNLKKLYSDLFNESADIQRDIDKLRADEQYKLRRIDLLSFQTQEISDASLKKDEDNELLKRKNILGNAEKIFSTLSLVYGKVFEAADGESAFDEIGTSISHLESVERYDEKLKEIKSCFEDIYYKLEDMTRDIRSYMEKIEFNPDELNEIEERLDLISKLKRKYGASIDDIIDFYDEAKKELEQIEKSEEITNELAKKLEKIHIQLNEKAGRMHSIRISTAEKLSGLIENELKYLGMEKAIFRVNIIDRSNYNENGRDDISFLMTANPGEPLRPLSKVASGGEMSRIMLAIKTVIADIDKIPTLIFDEIDTGISGRTAQAVAEKMSEISLNHQLLCVTHLPQIASMADTHFNIQKNVKNEKTATNVSKLNFSEQVDELARMLGGAVVTDLTRNHAREMLQLAEAQKKQI